MTSDVCRVGEREGRGREGRGYMAGRERERQKNGIRKEKRGEEEDWRIKEKGECKGEEGKG